MNATSARKFPRFVYVSPLRECGFWGLNGRSQGVWSASIQGVDMVAAMVGLVRILLPTLCTWFGENTLPLVERPLMATWRLGSYFSLCEYTSMQIVQYPFRKLIMFEAGPPNFEFKGDPLKEVVGSING